MPPPTDKPSRGVPVFPYIPSTHSPSPSSTDNGRISTTKGTRHIPTPPLKPSEQPDDHLLGHRTVNAYTSEAAVNEAAHTEHLKRRFGKQWNTVQVLRAQNHMLEHLDAIIQSLNAPESISGTPPFTIIHIDETGAMNRLVPPDPQAFQKDSAKAGSARNQLIDRIRKIDTHYTREQTHEFKNTLGNAEATLIGLGVQLQAAGVKAPPIPRGFVSTSLTDFLLARTTDSTGKSSSTIPVTPSPIEAPVTSDLHYQPQPVHEPEAEEPYFESSFPPPPPPPPPPPMMKRSENGPLSSDKDNTPNASPEELNEPPLYLTEINESAVFTDPAKKADPVELSAPFALQAGDPEYQTTEARYGSAHITRKAILFELLIKQHRISGHEEAIHLKDDIVRLIQLGGMATGISEQDLLNKKPDPRAEAECKSFLLEAESVTPSVASFVASIVAGTGYQNSLAAKIMRDTIRLEAMRFSDDFDINSLESNRGYPVQSVQQKVATKFCDQWRRLLACEGELSMAARLSNRAAGVAPVEPGDQPQEDPARRSLFDTDENPYTKHIELLNEDEHLGFLKNLINH